MHFSDWQPNDLSALLMTRLQFIGGTLVIFGIVFFYNWFSRSDWNQFLHDTRDQVSTLEQDISSLQNEQAELARVLHAVTAVEMQNQRQYEQRKAQEQGEKAKAVWGIRIDGSLIAQLAVTKQQKTLDELRNTTAKFESSVVRSLRVIQHIISPPTGNASGFKPPDHVVSSVREQLALLETTTTATTQLIVQMRAELTDEASSLKDQGLKIKKVMPVGVDRAVPMTDDTVKAVESVLKANTRVGELLARLEESTDKFGKVVYRTGDIIKSQSAFMTARM
jgi:hypothetical protein